MKILWVVNIMLPQIAKELKLGYSNREGWLSGLFNKVCENETEYEIAVAYPVNDESLVNEITVNGIKCYSFLENLSTPWCYDTKIESSVKDIIRKFNPDILHIFGTEFPHSLSAAVAFNNPSMTLVGIQGVCFEIAKDYMAKLPENVTNKATFRDFIKKDSLKDQKKKFELRADNETKLIRNVLNITGRTTFDMEYSRKTNPSAVYFKMNETMRDSFYCDKWEYDSQYKHTIFLGQGDYPIKGMHFLFSAAGLLVSKYPDLKIKIAGNSIISNNSLKDKIKTPEYGAYLRKLAKKNKIEENIKVLGPLSEEEMKREYLSSSVYVCPSYMENSPNTVAEAMLLGMPVIASDAGGIKSIISNKEGFIFERGNASELASLIEKVFSMEDDNKDELKDICERAYERAHTDYDGDRNYRRLIEIYKEIGKKI